MKEKILVAWGIGVLFLAGWFLILSESNIDNQPIGLIFFALFLVLGAKGIVLLKVLSKRMKNGLFRDGLIGTIFAAFLSGVVMATGVMQITPSLLAILYAVLIPLALVMVGMLEASS